MSGMDILIALLAVGLVAYTIAHYIGKKRRGESGCGCDGCNSCPMSKMTEDESEKRNCCN